MRQFIAEYSVEGWPDYVDLNREFLIMTGMVVGQIPMAWWHGIGDNFEVLRARIEALEAEIAELKARLDDEETK